MSKPRKSHYYRVVGHEHPVWNWISEVEAGYRNRRKLADEMGASGFTSGIGSWGLIWDDKEDVPDYMRYRKTWQDWVPNKQRKAGKQLARRMYHEEQYRVPSVLHLSASIGLSITRGTPGFHLLTGKTAVPILSVPRDFRPEGCERISDVEYEDLCREHGEEPVL